MREHRRLYLYPPHKTAEMDKSKDGFAYTLDYPIAMVLSRMFSQQLYYFLRFYRLYLDNATYNIFPLEMLLLYLKLC